MAISVVMPALEMAQETGKLLAWRKQEGERVIKGEPLLEVETDKAVVEIEAPGAEAVRSPSGRRSDGESAAAAPAVGGGALAMPPADIRISPKARRLAS